MNCKENVILFYVMEEAMDKRPIGVFDSGFGGLTVLSELTKVLPNENYIYFGDTARVPYGSKSKDTIVKYSKEIVNFLISKNVKMIVIACGTASSLAYNELVKEFDIPIINVITPTAKSIKQKNICVIATKATIKSNVWKKEILKYNNTATITSKACPLTSWKNTSRTIKKNCFPISLFSAARTKKEKNRNLPLPQPTAKSKSGFLSSFLS